ncbi:MAG: erythronolide synthase [Actinomycetia bacterium]|nr:erythronolide synthase [Actinomycetes bacterium]
MASERLGVLESLTRGGLPLTRFIDRVIVHYPGIELVADADLSASSDPYLADHLPDGDLRLPAVLGMEAMAQAGHALTGAGHPPAFENVAFLRPIVVPSDGTTTIRVAALNTLLLGDPGTRDAFMHAIQCCVPNATLLPAGVERLYPAAPSAAGERVTQHAVQRSRVGDTYTYDLDIRDVGGAVVERWEGLRLQAVRTADGSGPWVPALLGPYLERQAAEFLPGAPRCAVEPDPSKLSRYAQPRRGQTTAALRRMLERPVTALHCGDGKPGLIGEVAAIPASRGAGVTLVVGHTGPVGCAVETVRQRTAPDWEGLLGPGQFALAQRTQRERGEDLSVAATRVCSAVESLRKTGRVLPGALTLNPDGRNGWVLFKARRSKIATFATRLRGEPDPVIFAIQTEGDGNEAVLRVPARREFRRDQPGGKRLLRELRALAGQVPRDVPA